MSNNQLADGQAVSSKAKHFYTLIYSGGGYVVQSWVCLQLVQKLLIGHQRSASTYMNNGGHLFPLNDQRRSSVIRTEGHRIIHFWGHHDLSTSVN